MHEESAVHHDVHHDIIADPAWGRTQGRPLNTLGHWKENE
jgi:hypothetical protein